MLLADQNRVPIATDELEHRRGPADLYAMADSATASRHWPKADTRALLDSNALACIIGTPVLRLAPMGPARQRHPTEIGDHGAYVTPGTNEPEWDVQTALPDLLPRRRD